MKKRKTHIKIGISIFILTILLINLFPIKALAASSVTQQLKSGIDNFPDTYKSYLTKLKELHPNWNFEAYYTGIDWNELIKSETGATLHTRSVVPSNKPSSWLCSQCDNIRGWTCASDDAVKYFIDPRNFLNEVNIFQFEELSFNKNIHTLASVQNSVKNTFLKNSVTYYDEDKKQNVTKSYSQIILEVAETTNISPFHIKSKIIQEVGSRRKCLCFWNISRI